MKYTLAVFLTTIFVCIAQFSFGQAIYDYEKRETYTIANLNIIGGVNRDKTAVKSMTGLRE
ncbi:MAG TPA: hypothetical protein PKD85_15730, partial [Saprospiraceae bacterium]|nr:hypothetical protein [Saprospiraceae bacterium]